MLYGVSILLLTRIIDAVFGFIGGWFCLYFPCILYLSCFYYIYLYVYYHFLPFVVKYIEFP